MLFCHVIETSDSDDLRRLADFLGSMQSVCEASEAAAKLHRLCQVLYHVAFLYAETKSQHPDQTMLPIGNEFDQYLHALGFMPVDENPSGGNVATGMGGGGAGSGGDLPSDVMSQTAILRDWFSGNRYMMGLLEEDLSQFSPRDWAGGI